MKSSLVQHVLSPLGSVYEFSSASGAFLAQIPDQAAVYDAVQALVEVVVCLRVEFLQVPDLHPPRVEEVLH